MAKSAIKVDERSNKYIFDECFKPLKEFSFGKPPTLKQVLESCFYFEDFWVIRDIHFDVSYLIF